MKILGISAYYHDSAAAIVKDGKIIGAAQEERFTRKKHDDSFPINAIEYCLEESNVCLQDLDYIIFYEKPLVKFERLIETYLHYCPRGFKSFVVAIPIWVKNKLFMKQNIKKELSKNFGVNKQNLPKLLFADHHQSHAASAFFPSPFKKSAVLCLDGVGEWDTTSVWVGDNNTLEKKWSIKFPHSLGLLYSAFTYYIGFKVNSGEYKLMGLAPYGLPKYKDKILNNLIDVKSDGTFQLDMSYFDYATGLKMINKKFENLFNGKPRKPEDKITQKEMDIASSIQVVMEEIILKIVNNIYEDLNIENLCLAGGVALNCVSNGRIIRETKFKNVWIQPAAGDAGGSIGSALLVWYQYLNNPRLPCKQDSMNGSYLGKRFSSEEIKKFLIKQKASFKECNESEVIEETAELISRNQVIGWFAGRMEFGPRALGNRSIIGNPQDKTMQKKMNLRIKYRESFRPFAPAILSEKVSDWFDLKVDSPYMLVVDKVKVDKCIKMTDEQKKLEGIEKLNIVRSSIPAVTHLDYSARVQTVHEETNPRFHKLLKEVEKITSCPILVNTSFNVRGEPIVNSPADAFNCFMRTEMDYLVLENFILSKQDQGNPEKLYEKENQFELD